MTSTPEPVRPIPSAPGFLASGARIFDLSLSEMLWSRRTIFMLLVVGAPVLIACMLRVVVALGAPILEGPRAGGSDDSDDGTRNLRADDLGLLSPVHGARARRVLWHVADGG